MNDESRNEGKIEQLEARLSVEREAAASAARALQEEVDRLNAQLDEQNEEMEVLEDEKETLASQVLELSQRSVTPAGDDELRALATTYRQALRNGHPDATKHLESLLNMLGA